MKRILGAGLLAALAACSKASSSSWPSEPVSWQDGAWVVYRHLPSEGNDGIRVTFVRNPDGSYKVGTADEDGGMKAITVDKHGKTPDGNPLLAAQALPGGPDVPLWIPTVLRKAGAVVWRLRTQDAYAVPGEESMKNLPVVREETKGQWQVCLAEYEFKSPIHANSWTVRAYYEKTSGFLVRYEAVGFIGGGTGLALTESNVAGLQ